MRAHLTSPQCASSYNEATSSTPVDSGTPQRAVPESTETLHCSLTDAAAWTPDTEQALVPEKLHAACRSCPARMWCLGVALDTDATGYWAGTTTEQRQRIINDEVTLSELDREHASAARAEAARRLHEPGAGSLKWYRAGCDCGECRAANAERGRKDRARAKRRRQQG